MLRQPFHPLLGQLFNQVIRELQLVPPGNSAKVANFVERNPARPRQKEPLVIELFEVSPQRQAAALKDILCIGIVRQQCADVRENPSLIPKEMLQKTLRTVLVLRLSLSWDLSVTINSAAVFVRLVFAFNCHQKKWYETSRTYRKNS